MLTSSPSLASLNRRLAIQNASSTIQPHRLRSRLLGVDLFGLGTHSLRHREPNPRPLVRIYAELKNVVVEELLRRLRAWETGSGVPPGPHGHSGTIGSVPGLSGGVLRDSGHLRLHDDDVYHIKYPSLTANGYPLFIQRQLWKSTTRRLNLSVIDLVHCSPTTYDRQAFLVYRCCLDDPAYGRRGVGSSWELRGCWWCNRSGTWITGAVRCHFGHSRLDLQYMKANDSETRRLLALSMINITGHSVYCPMALAHGTWR
ncbi:hypothetical protein WG66_009199 [Moniliophthora roreri]|nr:hypothetical protein WG66_009199 [Moniliophthora roreri]